MSGPEASPATDGIERPDDAEEAVDVGVLVARSPNGDEERLRSFTERLVGDVEPKLSPGTAVPWRFHAVEVASLPDGHPRRPSVFIDDVSARMAEGPHDLSVVVTDVPIVSHQQKSVPGLASPISRTAVLSTAKLLTGARRESATSLDAEPIRWNAATLLLHLVGHVLGAAHDRAGGGVMAPFRFDPGRRSIPAFDVPATDDLRQVPTRIPDGDESTGTRRSLAFHAASLRRHPWQVVRAVATSGGLMLPLSLPKLTTAAVTPTLILVFSAETWDVGLHLDNVVAATFALVSLLAAALHLVCVHDLLFPREPGRTITEHMALVNVAVFLILLLGMVGLFLLVGVIILVIELYIFLQNLMSNWPTLEDPTVCSIDLVRTAVFISTLGVLSGALAGGIENRAVVRHLALFEDRP
jgi:hypothetical protein